MSSAIFPVAYLAPVSHFALFVKYEEIVWEIQEYYHKQFLYNRCHIYSPNGIQKLVIPVHKSNLSVSQNLPKRLIIKDVKICYDSPWQKIHWRSFESAYRRSPYFEFYEENLYPLYMGKYRPDFLLDWNTELFGVICKCLGIRQGNLHGSAGLTFTEKYHKTYHDIPDYRFYAANGKQPDIKLNKYHQVFEEKHGFLANMSIVDVLFCEGPYAKEYLMNIDQNSPVQANRLL